MLSSLNRFVLMVVIGCAWNGPAARAELRVGAAKVDITPLQMPVWVNGGMTARSADQVTTRIHARAIVLDDGIERIGICVVDSCMIPKHLCDEAKSLTASRTGIAVDRLLISATHTHTAPSSMGALGTDADPAYVPFLRQKIAEAFEEAEGRLQPARVGWGSGEAPNFTALRRWVRRPDRIAEDPFGNATVRATMHAARNPDDAIGPTGPEDPELSLIAFQSLDGKPLAVLNNFSMHYFGGESPISADYFGIFCGRFEQFLSGEDESDVVAVMSHGCSGDIWRRDYMTRNEEADGTMEEYSIGLLEIAKRAYADVQFEVDVDLAMQQQTLAMSYRLPDAQRLEWARRVVSEMGDRPPQTQPEVYAREQILLDELQSTEIVLQAIRIGDIAIATTPNETYALTGLKLKLQSPLEKTMVIELANGGDGYIPPPEQHELGGYNTWAARSAGLETTAEPRIVATDLMMLEEVTGKPRRESRRLAESDIKPILATRPVAFWRLDEMQRWRAHDFSGNRNDGFYEPGVLFFLDGPTLPNTNPLLEGNRCVHFAGGRLRAELSSLRDQYSVVLSFWNGMPLEAREVSGWMISHDYEDVVSRSGLHLGLDGAGRLVLQIGRSEPVCGQHAFPRWQWGRVALVHTVDEIKVFLPGQREPEIRLRLPSEQRVESANWFFGGRSDNQSNWEGKLDEIVVFDRSLTEEEVVGLLEFGDDTTH